MVIVDVEFIGFNDVLVLELAEVLKFVFELELG